jgi:hypothetical protein
MFSPCHSFPSTKVSSMFKIFLVAKADYFLHCIEQHRFNSDQDIRRITLNDALPEFKSPNEEQVGELLLGFFNYYVTSFE